MIKKMKRLTIFICLSFIGLAVFGFIGMNHGSGHGYNGCIAVMAKGVSCPEETNSLSFLNFHVNAFKSFSTAVFGGNALAALLFLAGLGLLIGSRVAADIFSAPPRLIEYSRYKHFLESFSPPRQKEFHWLALRENSPTAL